MELVVIVVALAIGAASIIWVRLGPPAHDDQGFRATIIGWALSIVSPILALAAGLRRQHLRGAPSIEQNANGGINVAAKIVTIGRAGASQEPIKLYRRAMVSLDSPKANTRRAGLHMLEEVADNWPEWRQRCVDSICKVLSDCYAATSSDHPFAREVALLIRSRLDPEVGDLGWGRCTFVIRDCTVNGLELPNLRLNGGTIRLANVKIAGAGLRMSGLSLEHGAALMAEHVSIEAVADLTGLLCAPGASAEFADTVISGGVLNLHRVKVDSSGTVSPHHRRWGQPIGPG
ncbi:hypothetical protein [Terracoccus luteus]|uniref:Pentapeptide repeat protein n=1 Tax=Terracoccus luteus TaxID=53356 RepID=A0A839PYJ5_9MICO|nr:hypothetical protein [Terracoccus luteus]MBB2988509.1 hypothetical protein [Terracoccus luteus]MCP2174159.1 hypothetical protein [Terracoccus luteus]